MEEKKNALEIVMEKVTSDGSKIYLIKWDTEKQAERYSWEPENILEGHEELVSNFWRSESSGTTEIGTQTSDSIWVSQELPQNKETDVFLNYSPNIPIENFTKAENEEPIPIKIIDFNKEESKFLTLFADTEEAKWCPCSFLLSLSPKLVAEYFIKREQNGGA